MLLLLLLLLLLALVRHAGVAVECSTLLLQGEARAGGRTAGKESWRLVKGHGGDGALLACVL